jgi:GINS complex subunit 2
MTVPWLPQELYFLAEEEEMVKIIPRFSCPRMSFLSGNYGPFEPNQKTRVPLWLALFLNFSQTCTMVTPSWLSLKNMQNLVKQEKENKSELGKVPAHYMELSFAFFSKSPESIRDLDAVKSLVEDLWRIRVEKIRKSLPGLDPNSDFEALENGTRMELHMFREPMTRIRELLTSITDLGREM